MTDIRDQYKKAAIAFAAAWRTEVSEHNINVMISIMMHRDKLMMGGGFVESVCNNNLIDAVTKADSDNLRVLKLLALTHKNCYINE